MASLAIYIIIMLAVAAIIILVGIVAYNKRLDKITSGEARDTHSSIPEPRTTVSAVYKIILMVIVVLSWLAISTANGMISSLQSDVSRLQSSLNRVSDDLYALQQQIEDSSKRVSLYEWEATDPDYAARTCQVRAYVILKEYSDDTAVSLSLNGRSVPLQQTEPGTYSGQFTAGFFERFDQPKICISEGSTNYLEDFDLADLLFWQFLPMPSLECRFESGMKLGKLTYGGEYALVSDNTEDIESAVITYVSNGRDLKTMDITKEALSHETITLEKGLDVEKDLSFRIELVTKSGYRVVEQTVVIFEASPDYADDDYLRIYDLNGNMIWEDDYK